MQIGSMLTKAPGPQAAESLVGGVPKQLLIGGRWVPAASVKTFESSNPATGDLLAHIAEAGEVDADAAVAAARAAFEGPWSKTRPFERQRLLLKLADLVDRDFEQFAMLDTLEMGMP
jgi:aldehyde dehydrogenase (NAD+)